VLIWLSLLLQSCFVYLALARVATQVLPLVRDIRAMIALLSPFACLATPLLALTLLNAGRLTLSSLEVSQEGIVYRQWPWFFASCSWNSVISLRRRDFLGLLHFDYLVLKEGAVRHGVSYGLRRLFNTHNAVFLSDLDGWPDGALADAIRAFAPAGLIPPQALARPAAPPPKNAA
jgi:hypothetical protein